MNLFRGNIFNFSFRAVNWRRSVIILVSLVLAGCAAKPVVTVPTEAEAIEIIDVLRENGIQSDKIETGDERNRHYQIIVGEDFWGGDNYVSAMQVLSDHCLPHTEPPPIQDGGFIASVEAEQAKVQRQLKMNIIAQLRKLPGVTCVDVNFVMPQDQWKKLDPYPATAGVLMTYKNQEIGFTDQEVKSLVARSIPNLQPDNVTVKLAYQPVRPRQRPAGSAIYRVLLVGSVGLVIIMGSISLVYWLQKRRHQKSGALAKSSSTDLEKQETEFPEAEVIE